MALIFFTNEITLSRHRISSLGECAVAYIVNLNWFQVCGQRQYNKLNMYDPFWPRTTRLYILVSREQGEYLFVTLDFSIPGFFSHFFATNCHPFSLWHSFIWFNAVQCMARSLSSWRNNENNITIQKLLSFRFLVWCTFHVHVFGVCFLVFEPSDQQRRLYSFLQLDDEPTLDFHQRQ